MPRRRSWLEKINPANWLKNLIPTPKRRRGSRDFGGGQKRETPINPSLPQFGARQSFGARQPFGPTGRQPRDREDYRDIWEEEGSQEDFNRLYSFFNSLPGVYENEDEREDVWRSFLRFSEPGGTRRNRTDNPFWSDLGIHPNDFDWEGWRAAMGY